MRTKPLASADFTEGVTGWSLDPNGDEQFQPPLRCRWFGHRLGAILDLNGLSTCRRCDLNFYIDVFGF